MKKKGKGSIVTKMGEKSMQLEKIKALPVLLDMLINEHKMFTVYGLNETNILICATLLITVIIRKMR